MSSKFWRKGFVEINTYVPDLDIPNEGQFPNSKRLQELQGLMDDALRDVFCNGEDEKWEFEIDGFPNTETDNELQCHFVNVRLLFEIVRKNKTTII
ncbi:hypothetical protein Barb6XT_01839 [Bacteroidales bacterium Barb6XT]|nr:hypothetical protein Barb6XT_01839 [Bacteroidales bacterium Barb6XT]